MIGIGVVIVIALMIMTSSIYAHHKKRHKELRDRGEPIVKNGSIEMNDCDKGSDVGYPFET